jgi:hypothetical protein
MRYKNNFLFPILAIILTSSSLLINSCKKNTTNADPTGTITATITNRGKVMVDSNNSPNAFIGYSDTTGVYNFVAGNGLITSIGSVANIAAITSKPSSGFSNAVKAVVGNGYVIVFQSGSYCRMYCVSMSGNTATIKYQYPY